MKVKMGSSGGYVEFSICRPVVRAINHSFQISYAKFVMVDEITDGELPYNSYL